MHDNGKPRPYVLKARRKVVALPASSVYSAEGTWHRKETYSTQHRWSVPWHSNWSTQLKPSCWMDVNTTTHTHTHTHTHTWTNHVLGVWLKTETYSILLPESVAKRWALKNDIVRNFTKFTKKNTRINSFISKVISRGLQLHCKRMLVALFEKDIWKGVFRTWLPVNFTKSFRRAIPQKY